MRQSRLQPIASALLSCQPHAVGQGSKLAALAPLARALCVVIAMVLAPNSSAWADCIQQAASYHGVNAHVLRAIGWHESRLQPDAIGRNNNGTIDIGAFQINSIHLPSLARYGIDQKSLKDGCVSAYVGAWHYKKQINDYGNTWFAVGAYHSRTPARAAWYANQIARQLMDWGIATKGPLPYPTEQTLAPSRTVAPMQPTRSGPSRQ